MPLAHIKTSLSSMRFLSTAWACAFSCARPRPDIDTRVLFCFVSNIHKAASSAPASTWRHPLRGSYLRSAAAVIGVGSTPFGEFEGQTADSLGKQALVRALADAKMTTADIDGLIVSRVSSYEAVAADFGISPRWCAQLPAEGRMTGPSIQLAVMAIHAGLCDTVALVYGNNGRSGGHTYGGEGAASSAAAEGYGTTPELSVPYGMTSPGAFYALMLDRHRAQFGTTDHQLAAVATTFRRHAELNPAAVFRAPLSTQAYLDSRYIVKPMRIYDYCLINDGGVALILTRADRAKDADKTPVYVRGFAQQSVLADSSMPPEDYWHGAISRVARETYQMADITRLDMDALMIYDNFSPNVLFSLEGMGYCAPGESGDWVQNGRIALDGEYPVNTSGGHLSESYMQGWGLVAEAVRQIRGECGARQVPDAGLVQYTCAAPVVSSVVFGKDR